MDAREIEDLTQRLLANPHDEAALSYAHRAGASDPKAYAGLLERVGNESRDAAHAAHWLSQAAEVWSATLGDAHRAARLLMAAVKRDPTDRTAAERLATLYREKGDVGALIALLDHRAKAMAPSASGNSVLQGELAGIHEELGRLWQEPPNNQPRKAIEHFKRAVECDPSSAYAIYSARELMKAEGMLDEALPLFAAELAVEQDPERRLALLRDEAETRKAVGDGAGASRVLLGAIELAPQDPALKQEFASSVLERVQAGENVGAERVSAVTYLIGLAQEFGGEHGYAYISGALEIDPGNDSALALYLDLARSLRREDEVAERKQAHARARSQASQENQASAAPPGARSAPPPAAPTQAGGSVRPATKAREADPLSIFDEEPRKRGGGEIGALLETGQKLALQGRKDDAFSHYKQLLDADPGHPEALAWVEDYLRGKRDYTQLRDVLMASVRAIGDRETVESKKGRLREVAGLCESQLRDIEGAIGAWRQLIALDRSDDGARTSLTRILEKTQRWDDLANVLEQDAMVEPDIDSKVALEKKLARLQEDKRKDLVGAADAWSRIARITAPNETALQAAIKLYERAERFELSAKLIDESIEEVVEPTVKGALLEKLGKVREKLGELSAAGDAYQRAAETLNLPRLWDEAERLFAQGEQWARAAMAAKERSGLHGDAKQQAALLARAADYLVKDGNGALSLEHLERATDLDPSSDVLAEKFEAALVEAREVERLVISLAKRSERVSDRTKRVALRKRGANVASKELRDAELARDLWLKVLKDGDDIEVLEHLIEDALGNNDHSEATTLLRRLANAHKDPADKVRITLREAETLASGVDDIDTALVRYEEILSDLDPKCVPALQAVAVLEEKRGNHKNAAAALDRELALCDDAMEKARIALRMASLHETLEDWENAIRSLDVVRGVDKEDFETLKRLTALCERTEAWPRVADLLGEQIAVEADEEEIAALTLRRAHVLADKLERNDEALESLTELADQGNADLRALYVTLGDKLKKEAVVAQKLVDWWFDARHTPERRDHLESAFRRFTEAGLKTEAIRVGIELVQSKGALADIPKTLATLALDQKDLEALGVAHTLLAREVSGLERAKLLVSQAHEKVQAGLGLEDAIQHGEEGLGGLALSDSLPLVERLAELTNKPSDIIDLHERIVGRMKGAAERTAALANAAKAAGNHGDAARARGFYELALSGVATEDTIAALTSAAAEADGSNSALTAQLVEALAAGGHGARDAGKTRSMLLLRAASLAHKKLGDTERAFALLTDSLITRVDEATIDELEQLANSVGDPDRTEAALSQALNEVFDGPLVRILLRRRATLRRNALGNAAGAAQDLKKLHDLNPQDHAVLQELTSALIELKDYRSLVQTYEDQFLRSKDATYRAELAHRVARLWEEQLGDAREAADAWRRVLRLKPGAEDATAGLDRAKKGALSKATDDDTSAYLPPPAPPKPEPAKKIERRPSVPPAAATPSAPTPPRSPTAPPPPLPRRASSSGIENNERRSAPPPPNPQPAAMPPLERMPVLDEEIAMSLEKLGAAPIAEDDISTGEAPRQAPVDVAQLDSESSINLDMDSSSVLLPADSADVVDAEDLAELVDVEEDLSSDTPPDGLAPAKK